MKKIASNSIASVYMDRDASGRLIIVKTSRDSFALDAEARMLRLLAPHIRVPKVYALKEERLTTEFIRNDGHCNGSCEEGIADALAALHSQRAEVFGLAFDTTIGPFRQDNRPKEKWVDFYRERRVLDFASKAFDEGAIDAVLLRRIEKLSRNLENYLEEPPCPSLLHGDIWGGNVLTRDNRFAALIDPACYYGHFEMELAFIGMFHTFGERFYARYGEHRPIEEDFFKRRAELYRIFPYLVHIRAFGSSYIPGLERILRRAGS